MSYYQANPACRCGRCRTRGLMGPAVLITLGLLFLLANLSDYPFQRTWPILLIVMGAIELLRYKISDSGHLNPGEYRPSNAGQINAGQTPQRTHPPPVAPPPAPTADAPGQGSGGNDEVHNG